LSLANLGNAGTFTGNGMDIACLDHYSVAKLIQGATYNTTNCSVALASSLKAEQTAPHPLLMRPSVK
jgi:hypothetical protein